MSADVASVRQGVVGSFRVHSKYGHVLCLVSCLKRGQHMAVRHETTPLLGNAHTWRAPVEKEV
jgi:hypothetical protein